MARAVKKSTKPSFKYEKNLIQQGYYHICGLDEAGCGPLAGPVVAAAVVFTNYETIKGLKDSKLLTPEQREFLYTIILNKAYQVGIGVIDHDTINKINIYHSANLAMLEALKALKEIPDYLLIDGNRPLDTTIPYETLVKGDRLCFSIAAASIIAKVTRDRIMRQYHRIYPEYHFDQHKGYYTALHVDMIRKYGPCDIHRIHYRGVKEFIR